MYKRKNNYKRQYITGKNKYIFLYNKATKGVRTLKVSLMIDVRGNSCEIFCVCKKDD